MSKEIQQALQSTDLQISSPVHRTTLKPHLCLFLSLHRVRHKGPRRIEHIAHPCHPRLEPVARLAIARQQSPLPLHQILQSKSLGEGRKRRAESRRVDGPWWCAVVAQHEKYGVGEGRVRDEEGVECDFCSRKRRGLGRVNDENDPFDYRVDYGKETRSSAKAYNNRS